MRLTRLPQIALPRGQFAIVDEDMYKKLSVHKWHYAGNYVVRRAKPEDARTSKFVRLHREVLGLKDPTVFADHINGNVFDNRRCNLRQCTKSQNVMNTPARANNKTGFKGVFRTNRAASPFRAKITIDGKSQNIGSFATARAASDAYESKAKELFGEFYRPRSECA